MSFLDQLSLVFALGALAVIAGVTASLAIEEFFGS